LADKFRTKAQLMNHTLLACGSGAGLIPIIYAALACWMVSGGFFVANFCLMFALPDGSLLRHGSAPLLYSALGLAGFIQAKSGADNGFSLLAARLDCLQASSVIPSYCSASCAANDALCAPSHTPRDFPIFIALRSGLNPTHGNRDGHRSLRQEQDVAGDVARSFGFCFGDSRHRLVVHSQAAFQWDKACFH
jgi:hypothetical protein